MDERSAEGLPADSLFDLLPRIANRLRTLWLQKTWPFAEFGEGTSIDWSCDIRRSICDSVSLGKDVYLAPNVWMNVVGDSKSAGPKIILRDGCKIGRRSTISCKNQITLETDVLFAPSVLVMDHNHEFSNTEIAIHKQGITEGGRIKIERGCWLGYGSVVVCGRGELVLGRNSVVAANAVVTRSFPPFSVVAGNPAKLVKTYDEQSKQWIKPHA